jgi:hypothetical protein
MPPHWTVVIDFDGAAAAGARTAARAAISRLAKAARVDIQEQPSGSLVVLTGDADAAERLASAARATDAVAAAYVKPPEAMP